MGRSMIEMLWSTLQLTNAWTLGSDRRTVGSVGTGVATAEPFGQTWAALA